MDAIEFLTQQHRNLEDLLGRVLDEQDAARKCELFTRAADDLTVHISSEEQVFYPAVRARRTDDILLESLEEHLSLKRLLADLLELAPTEQTFEPKFKVLREQTEHHHKEEEEHLFPKVQQLLDASQLRELGEQMLGMQQGLRREGAPRESIPEQTEEAAPLTSKPL
jgi:hemerythrin superfamily protein